MLHLAMHLLIIFQWGCNSNKKDLFHFFDTAGELTRPEMSSCQTGTPVTVQGECTVLHLLLG